MIDYRATRKLYGRSQAYQGNNDVNAQPEAEHGMAGHIPEHCDTDDGSKNAQGLYGHALMVEQAYLFRPHSGAYRLWKKILAHPHHKLCVYWMLRMLMLLS